MSQPGPPPTRMSNAKSFLICLALLVAVLSVLFRANFNPDQVSFSNDAPVGAVNASARAVPGVLTGVWMDLNWVGGPEPTPALNLSMLIRLVAKTAGVILNRIYAPASLLIVGLCAWILFWQLRFAPLTCILGGLAATLNSDFLNTSCWGVCSQPIAFGMNYLALGALADTTSPRRWLRVVLAGFAVGLGVTEAYDIGALFSMVVAAFVVVQALVNDGPLVRRILNGLGSLALVGGCAGLIAASALSTLVGTQIKGVVGAGQDAESKAARWSFATQYSIPKAEALGILVPGLFGFRSDSPAGGAYWGRAGSDPSWDEFVDSSGQRGQPERTFRAGAGSNYAGVLVILLAVFGVAQSFRKQGGPFTISERKLIWFWGGVVVVALLLMFGRFAPFYQFFYALPYVSTIRNPAKFLHVVEWALLILFAYGVEALWRTGFVGVVSTATGLMSCWQSWWARVKGFDRRWVIGSFTALAVFGLAWLIYATSRDALERHVADLTNLQYAAMGQKPDAMAVAESAKATASFSIGQAGRALLFSVLAVALVGLILSGYFRGSRVKIGSALLFIFLIADLLPIGHQWVVSVNWKEKYESNSIIEFLRPRPYLQRVALFPPNYVDLRRLPRELMPRLQQYQFFVSLYGSEWTQHLFPYNDIHTLDIVQEPRVATDKAAYESVLLSSPLRRWELTNTRYLIGPTLFLDLLNRQFDAGSNRFRVAAQFDLAAKPGADASGPRAEQITTTISTNGQLAVFDFTGALPRAKLYSNWKVSTNEPAKLREWMKGIQTNAPADWSPALAAQSDTDLATLHELVDKSFDPAQTVLLSEPLPIQPGTNQNPGEVKFESYAPKHIVLKARADSPAVLLLNDKYDPNWQVRVDGQPAPLLRCNFMMRGVQVPAGEHQIEFHFAPPLTGLYVSLVALLLGAGLLGFVALSPQRPSPGGTGK